MNAPTDADQVLIAEVLDAEERRNRSLMECDWPTLEQLLADDLSYTHLSGRTETKAVYFAGAQNRQHSVQRSDLQVRIFGDVAVMTGGIAFAMQGEGAESAPLEGVALQVWAKRNARWQMVALQATRTGTAK